MCVLLHITILIDVGDYSIGIFVGDKLILMVKKHVYKSVAMVLPCNPMFIIFFIAVKFYVPLWCEPHGVVRQKNITDFLYWG